MLEARDRQFITARRVTEVSRHTGVTDHGPYSHLSGVEQPVPMKFRLDCPVGNDMSTHQPASRRIRPQLQAPRTYRAATRQATGPNGLAGPTHPCAPRHLRKLPIPLSSLWEIFAQHCTTKTIIQCSKISVFVLLDDVYGDMPSD